ncbi:MAG: hypothetical protein V1779_08930 [bacterium]
MNTRKLILNQLLDIGGVATKNNFFSPKAKTVDGSVLKITKFFNEWLKDGFIRELPTVTRVKNKRQETFYCITSKGADYIGRKFDYKYKDPKSPNNVMHESMKFDIAMSFLRNYPDFSITFSYDDRFGGLQPDIVVRMTQQDTGKEYVFFIEIERKKTVDRVYKEKLLRYEKVLNKLDYKVSNLPRHLKVLVIYSNLNFDCFLRTQDYKTREVGYELSLLEKQITRLVVMSKNLPDRYRFITFNQFVDIGKPIWLTPKGQKVLIIN